MVKKWQLFSAFSTGLAFVTEGGPEKYPNNPMKEL